jgi:transposase
VPLTFDSPPSVSGSEAAVSFREVRVFEVRELLRLWLRGKGLRPIADAVGLDRKTVRRYIDAAVVAGVDRDSGDEAQLTDGLIGAVCEAVRPSRPDGHGRAWATLVAHHAQIKAWVDDELTAVKIHELAERQGIVVPYRTLARYVVECCNGGRQQTTVRVADGEPGGEVQVDFGRMGLVFDADTGRRRVCHALIFTACYSRHCFVWLTFRQTTSAVIAGFEEAWSFFGGVFAVVIPDNMATVVTKADATAPRLNQAFVEYAQARGFEVDAARVRHPKDKPRVERTVPFVRDSFFGGETFIDLGDAQRRAIEWCTTRAGLRVHGTTQRRPAEVFALEEQPRLLAAPASAYELPHYATAKVHRDHHIEVAKALYSIPGNLIGETVEVRADRALVKVFYRGQLVKTHPRTRPGGRITDAADLPSEKTAYAMRDLDYLRRVAAKHGAAIGRYVDALLDTPLPWTKMRQVYRLMGLVRRWGEDRVDVACARALDAEAVDVNLIARMLERATENTPPPTRPPTNVVAGRFARDPSEFARTAGAKR